MKFTVWSSLLTACVVFGTGASAQTTPPAQRSTIGWPPRLEVGQLWVATIGKLSFNINLNKKDADGDPAGTATDNQNGAYTAFFYFNAKEGLADLYLKGARTSYRCLFSSGSVSKDNPNDVTMIGAGFLFNASAPVATDRFVQQPEPCIVTWTNAPSAPVSIQTGNSTSSATAPTSNAPSSTAPASSAPASPAAAVTPPPAPPAPAATTPPAAPAPNVATAPARVPATTLALTWPPKLQSGQGWYLTVGNSGYDISLTALGTNGIARGTAQSANSRFEAYFYFVSNENRAVLELVALTYTLSCSFNVRGAEDKVLNGDASTKIGNGNPQALRDRCALYLVTAPAGAALLTTPLL